MRKSPAVLIVDDNPADLDLAREALRDSTRRSQISTAVNGEDALAILRQKGDGAKHARPDLVILDLNMPRKSGRSVLAELKTDPQLQGIPVVVFSASSLDADISHSYDLGANCYVTKPLNLNDYFTTVRAIEEFWFGVSRLPEGKQC